MHVCVCVCVCVCVFGLFFDAGCHGSGFHVTQVIKSVMQVSSVIFLHRDLNNFSEILTEVIERILKKIILCELDKSDKMSRFLYNHLVNMETTV